MFWCFLLLHWQGSICWEVHQNDWYGRIDHCVPVNQKYYLMGAYILHNVPYDYIEFPKSNHGMYNDPDKLQEFLEKSLEYAERYFTD